MIEVYTEFEKKEFVIERLFKGSIVNYRTFFMEERGSVNLRFAAPSVLKVLSKEKMNMIIEKHPQLGTVFNKYKLKIIKDSKAIPLDYVMALPKKITD
jgi:CRP-like cAMP-binding protein